jgi:hypothetical protein
VLDLQTIRTTRQISQHCMNQRPPSTSACKHVMQIQHVSPLIMIQFMDGVMHTKQIQLPATLEVERVKIMQTGNAILRLQSQHIVILYTEVLSVQLFN